MVGGITQKKFPGPNPAAFLHYKERVRKDWLRLIVTHDMPKNALGELRVETAERKGK